MKVGGVLAFMVMIPIFALFGAVGIWAFQLSQTWDVRHTDQLLAATTAVCGLGIVTLGVLAFGAFRVMAQLAEHREQRREELTMWKSLPRQQKFPELDMGSMDEAPATPIQAWDEEGSYE